MTISVYIATSLDGFIAAEDDDLRWLSEIPNNNYHKVNSDDSQVYLSNWGSGLTIEENPVKKASNTEKKNK